MEWVCFENQEDVPFLVIVVHIVGGYVDYKNVSVVVLLVVFMPAVEQQLSWWKSAAQRHLLLSWQQQDVFYLQYELLTIV